jgi:hypothetical protein
MIRVLVLGLAALLIGFTMNANAATRDQTRRERQCRFQWMDGGIWTQREEDRTVACVLAKYPTPGGTQFFRQVIDCESGFHRLAYNAAGPYVGLAQHHLASWFGRVRSYLPDWWRAGHWARWSNSRSQIVVTARMVRAEGWGAWTCA